MLKAFGYEGCPEECWGTRGGVIFAENEEEAREILNNHEGEDFNLWEIPIEKGINNICSYLE